MSGVEATSSMCASPDLQRQLERTGRAPRRGGAPGGGPGVQPSSSVAGKNGALSRGSRARGRADRPAAGARPAATWTGAELDQVKAAYNLIPANDRPALGGVTIVRTIGAARRPAIAGQVLTDFAHRRRPSPAHDTPGPAAHGPPHIHYYDAAFATNAVASVGPPGGAGDGSRLDHRARGRPRAHLPRDATGERGRDRCERADRRRKRGPSRARRRCRRPRHQLRQNVSRSGTDRGKQCDSCSQRRRHRDPARDARPEAATAPSRAGRRRRTRPGARTSPPGACQPRWFRQ